VTPRKTDLIRNDTRRLIAHVLSEQRGGSAATHATSRWGLDIEDMEQRAAVGAITDADLVPHSTVLLDLILEQSIVGRLGARAVPVDSRVSAIDTGVTVIPIGEQATPSTKPLRVGNYLWTLQK
jgi:hypothetical protein